MTPVYSWSRIELIEFELIFIEFFELFLLFWIIESQIFKSNWRNFERIPIWLHPYKIHSSSIMFGKILFSSWQFERHHKICYELMFCREQMSTAALKSCQTFEIWSIKKLSNVVFMSVTKTPSSPPMYEIWKAKANAMQGG